jgi:hypothetical protein
MATNRPDPGDFLEMAQRMLRQLFDNPRDDEPWADATSAAPEAPRRNREPSHGERRENLTFALATRAVEALEDLALNVAAIRQRLERTSAQTDGRPTQGDDATGQ